MQNEQTDLIMTKYACLFPNCTHIYAKTDGVRKHARKKHTEWIKRKKPKEYSFIVPTENTFVFPIEYDDYYYVTDYITMVKYIVNDL